MVSSHAADEAVASGLSQWVVFNCGDHRFGLPLDRTREILPPRSCTRLPGCGPEVAGLVGIRGRVLTVFDFGIVAAEHHRWPRRITGCSY
jgi:purine-binding chemotaxis protein CheW